ncbi:MAG: hypothetical protein DLD55_03440 [candidate division SR1 bacterium]|nr:MAG: hypothetical protein DLD55_03440 [candidate division SR1 bacterium]
MVKVWQSFLPFMDDIPLKEQSVPLSSEEEQLISEFVKGNFKNLYQLKSRSQAELCAILFKDERTQAEITKQILKTLDFKVLSYFSEEEYPFLKDILKDLSQVQGNVFFDENLSRLPLSQHLLVQIVLSRDPLFPFDAFLSPEVLQRAPHKELFRLLSDVFLNKRYFNYLRRKNIQIIFQQRLSREDIFALIQKFPSFVEFYVQFFASSENIAKLSEEQLNFLLPYIPGCKKVLFNTPDLVKRFRETLSKDTISELLNKKGRYSRFYHELFQGENIV